MLANNALLSAEVNRILEAPYPCSLQVRFPVSPPVIYCKHRLIMRFWYE